MEKNGSYGDEGVIWHQHSNRLLIAIMKLWGNDTKVRDIGCGHNWYANTLKFFGYDAMGIDGADFPSVDVVKDVTEPLMLEEGSNVMSFEVGEHIPLEKCTGYFDNLCSTGGDVILSWALPGQAGIGHINCQSNEWVIVLMRVRGYKIDWNRSMELRRAVADCHCSWFRETLMYFVKY